MSQKKIHTVKIEVHIGFSKEIVKRYSLTQNEVNDLIKASTILVGKYIGETLETKEILLHSKQPKKNKNLNYII